MADSHDGHVRENDHLPGVAEDERIDPRLRRLFKEAPEFADALKLIYDREIFETRDDKINRMAEKAQQLLVKLANMKMPGTNPAAFELTKKDELNVSTLEFKSQPDGNMVKILFVRPKEDKVVPLVYYIHGGGMAIGSAMNPEYREFARVIANSNNVAVAVVDFRNCELPSLSNMDVAPYPAGLNDCYSGLKFMHNNAAEYGIDPNMVCVAGESGGGNLTIATALKCKKEGTLNMIPKGFYAMCPYIAGIWPQTVQNEGILGSSHLFTENNGKFITLPGDTNAAIGYSLEAFKNRDPLAWPGFATIDDLKGLPRCVISVNEVCLIFNCCIIHSVLKFKYSVIHFEMKESNFTDDYSKLAYQHDVERLEGLRMEVIF
mmetsp:Transcript_1563/g.2272  ORF Transcript_1563/g.2272 Transcript_1563/m.2272 type:complete len:376 (-) Transcript_1563:1030-2157(-)